MLAGPAMLGSRCTDLPCIALFGRVPHQVIAVQQVTRLLQVCASTEVVRSQRTLIMAADSGQLSPLHAVGRNNATNVCSPIEECFQVSGFKA